MGIAAYGDLDGRRVGRARALTLAWLTSTVITSILMPGIGLLREPRPVWVALGAIGILVFATAQAGVLYSAVAGRASRAKSTWTVSFAGASALSTVLVGPVAAGSWSTWGWIGGAIIGTLPALLRMRWMLPVSVGVGLVAALVASLTGASVTQMLFTTAAAGSALALVNMSVLWLWNVILEAQAGREATAALAVSEERLRFARDVHDILGHTLSVIALKAELLERRPADAEAISADAAEIRRLAAGALEEMRAALAGSRRVDLRDEVDALQRVLEASGVRCTVAWDIDPADPRVWALGPVVREAVTNVLRHSRASWCEISLAGDGVRATLTVRNDGAAATRAVSDPASGGIDGIRGRLRDLGGSLSVRRSDDTFELLAEIGAPA